MLMKLASNMVMVGLCECKVNCSVSYHVSPEYGGQLREAVVVGQVCGSEVTQVPRGAGGLSPRTLQQLPAQALQTKPGRKVEQGGVFVHTLIKKKIVMG